MTRALWMIQLYNVSATNRPNLLGNSTPQKTITVVEASLKVVIMLPFWVLASASQLRQEKWRNISHFLASSLSIQSLGMWAAVKMRKTRNKRRVKLARFGGRKNRNRKNDKGFVNYALWNGKFSETKWSKGWERGERRSKSFPLWIVWEHNLITEAEFQHQTYSYLDTVLIAIAPPTTRGLCWITLVCKSCSFLVGRWVVIRLSAAQQHHTDERKVIGICSWTISTRGGSQRNATIQIALDKSAAVQLWGCSVNLIWTHFLNSNCYFTLDQFDLQG